MRLAGITVALTVAALTVAGVPAVAHAAPAPRLSADGQTKQVCAAPAKKGQMHSCSGNLATMVPGVPYAIAAKFAYPDRVSVAMVGDGAMQMGGMAEMLTAAKYFHEWDDPRMVILVLNNEDLNQVTWEQRVMEGDPAFEASQEIPYVDYAAWAQMIGLRGIKIDKAEEIEDAWRQAFASDRPVIISALTDPNEPPGCLLLQSGLTCGDEASDIPEELARHRAATELTLRERFECARSEGDLPKDANAAALARYVMAVSNGICVQASSGSKRKELRQIAEMALSAFPDKPAHLAKPKAAQRKKVHA